MGQSGPEGNCASCRGQVVPVTLLAIAALPPEVPGAMAGGLTAHRFTCPWRQRRCRAWREGVRHWWQDSPTLHRPVGLLCRALSTDDGAPLSPFVAGAAAPCRAPRSPQPVDATALSKQPPGWYEFCPCLTQRQQAKEGGCYDLKVYG